MFHLPSSLSSIDVQVVIAVGDSSVSAIARCLVLSVLSYSRQVELGLLYYMFSYAKGLIDQACISLRLM